jgi:caspase 7
MSEIAVPKYDMNHEKRGIALLINIRSYDAPNQRIERNWSEKDLENLKETLKYLEFDIRSYENLKAKQIKDEIQNIAKLDHTNSDCFLCVVMSHGNDEKIMTSDNKAISFDEIMTPIKSCRSLRFKPKLFFIQQFDLSPDIHMTRMTSHRLKEPESDLLIFNSKLPNDIVCAIETGGSFFISSVCKELNQTYNDFPLNIPLSQMIRRIIQRSEKNKIQVPNVKNGLTKEIYFVRKSVSVSTILLILIFYLFFIN